MELLFSVLGILCFVYFVVLLGRIVVDLVRVLARDWRPHGVGLVIIEGVYLVTDPPLRFLRRLIPPLRLGRVQLDLAFLVLMLTTSVLVNVFGSLAA